jgi:hypothetical protein
MNESAASPRRDLPVAVIEAPPSVVRHLSFKDGRLLVDSKHEWRVLRHFRVRIVEQQAPKLDSRPDLPTDAESLLRLTPGKFDVGVDALAGLLAPGDRGYRPYSVWVEMHLRVHMRGATGEPRDFSTLFGGSHRVMEPSDEAREQALIKLLTGVDRVLQRHLGVRMLRVRKGDEAGKTVFYVGLENVYPFSVKGTVRCPEEEQYRVVAGQRPFLLAPGQVTEWKVELTPKAPDVRQVIPTWWTREYCTLRERYSPFEFPALELNAQD